MLTHPVLMTYKEAIDWLYATQQFGIKLGLSQPRRLLRETLSFPKSGVKVIHVAGTNGKGSTCAMIDALARASGTRVGLFSSPHLIDYRERIKVSGADIDQDICTQYLTDIKNHVSKWEHHPTFFEITLAVAMRHFREKNCDLIILETGMGGRLDATTAVPADVAVITPIAMDHAQWLGDTLEAIAGEKAGIIVAKKPVLSSRQDPAAWAVIEEEANEQRSPIDFITEPLAGYSVNLPGTHQKENAALAIAAAEKVGIALNYDIVRLALSTVNWPGRFERLENPHIILDGAHNIHAAHALVKTWQEKYPDQKAHILFGALEQKDTAAVLSTLAPIAEHLHLTPIDSPRSLNAVDYHAAAPSAPPHTVYSNLAEAFKSCISTPQDVPTLICGSLFLIGQVKALLHNTETRPSAQ